MKHSYTAPSLRIPPSLKAAAPTDAKHDNLPVDPHKPSRFNLVAAYEPMKFPKGYEGWNGEKLQQVRTLNQERFKTFQSPKNADKNDNNDDNDSEELTNPEEEQPELSPANLWQWTAPTSAEVVSLDKFETPRWGRTFEHGEIVHLDPRSQDELTKLQNKVALKDKSVTYQPAEGYYPANPPTLPTLLPGGRVPLAWENALFLSRMEEMCYHNTNLGLEFSRKGHLRKARACHMRALEAAIKLQHVPRQNLAVGNLGLVSAKMRDYATAQRWFVRHLELSTMLRDRKGCYRACKHLGQIATADGRHEEAAHYFQRSLQISQGGAQQIQRAAATRLGFALGSAQVDSVMKRLGESLMNGDSKPNLSMSSTIPASSSNDNNGLSWTQQLREDEQAHFGTDFGETATGQPSFFVTVTQE